MRTATPILDRLESRILLHGAVELAVNFQPASAVAPADLLVDQGMPYGNRGDGLEYGWRRGQAPSTNRWAYERNHPASGDQVHDTLISAGWTGNLCWEIALPPGLYSVTLTAGDAMASPGQRFVGALEGEIVLDFAATRLELFRTVMVEVEVSDGRLTLGAPDGIWNTTFAGIGIQSAERESGGHSHGDGQGSATGGEHEHQEDHAAGSVALSSTAVINFEELSIGNIGQTYTHFSGQRFRSLPGSGGSSLEDMWVRGPADRYASKVLHPTNYGRRIVVDRADGTSFSLPSFDYGAGRWNEAGDVVVTGFFAGGGSSSQTVSFTSRSLQTLNLDWTDLTKLEINFAGGVNDAYGALDNFIVTSGGGGGGGGDDVFQEFGGRVDIEAEAFTGQAPGTGNTANHTWTQISDAAARGGQALQATPNSGVNKGDSISGPRRDYAINFTTTGTYHVWVRIAGASGSDDSLHVGLNGVAASLGSQGIALASSQRNGAWHWMDRTASGTRVTVNVAAAGVHTLNLWMREDGVKVDGFILTRDASFDPDDPDGGGENEGTITLGSWTSHGSMPAAMMEGAVAVLNGHVYLWGGFNSGSTWLSQKHGWRYNPSNNTWTRLADLPAPITHGQMIVYDGQIYLFGGYANNGSFLGSTDAVYRYDPASNAFSLWNTIPYKISSHGAALVGTRVHILGGDFRDSQNRFVYNSVRHVSIDLANPGAGWRNEPDVPAGRDHVPAKYVDGAIYYFGGQINHDEYTGVRSEMWRYDVTTRTWSSRASMPDGGRGHIDQASVLFQGRIISVAGNINAPVLTNYSDEVFIYDPIMNRWSVLGLIPEWRRGVQAVVIGDRLWVFGGGTSYPRDNVWSAQLIFSTS